MLRVIILRMQRWVQPELNRTISLLKRANKELGQALDENKTLKREKGELTDSVRQLTADNRELHHQVDLLNKANEVQREMLARMERYQKELQQKYENVFARVIQLEARLDSK